MIKSSLRFLRWVWLKVVSRAEGIQFGLPRLVASKRDHHRMLKNVTKQVEACISPNPPVLSLQRLSLGDLRRLLQPMISM